MGNKLCD